MQKVCSACATAQPVAAFAKRSASADGLAAACKACMNSRNRLSYAADPALRAASVARAVTTKRARFEHEPGYRRAFVLWGSTRRRTRIPPWVCIADFVPICQLADLLGPEFEIDHVVPLNHPLVCGLHVPNNVRIMFGELHRVRRMPSLEELQQLP